MAAAELNTRELIRVASAASLPRLDAPPADPSTRALRRTVELLRDGLERLEDVPGYTAMFEKREAVDGVLLDPQVMGMTLRHEPFGVHLAWREGQRGRSLLYEAGLHDGRMLVNPGGWRGRLTGTVRLDPNGALARRENRHPVTELGLKRLAAKLLAYRIDELGRAGDLICTLADGYEHDGRPAWRNVLEYRSPEANREFRRSIVLIDREWNLPVSVRTHGWPSADVPADELDARTLTGRYSYTDVDLAAFGGGETLDDLAGLTGFQVR